MKLKISTNLKYKIMSCNKKELQCIKQTMSFTDLGERKTYT